MVIALPMGNDGAVRWFTCLTAASCLLFAVSTLIEVSKPTLIPDVSQVLKVSLRTLATAAPQPQKTAPMKPLAKPTVPKPPLVEVKKEAKKKIPSRAPKVEPQFKPIIPMQKPEVVEELSEQRLHSRELERVERKPVMQSVKPEVNNAGKDISSVIQEARYRKQIPPVYPRRSYELGQQGLVILHAEVMPNGRPNQLTVFKSSGHRRLDVAAVSAVKKWEFETSGTTPMWVRVPVRFVIN